MPSNSIKRSNDPVLDRIVTGYKPVGMIRDQFLPKIPVTALKGDILAQGTNHTRIHNNVKLRRSQTPEMTFDITTATGWSIDSYGLKVLVTEEDGEEWNPANPQAGFSAAKAQMGEIVRDAQMLAAENALASVVTTAASYSSGNKVTLSGTDTQTLILSELHKMHS